MPGRESVNTDWEKQRFRIVQYNLQIHDSDKMIPEKIVAGVKRAAANALVLNVGGIYAWYKSHVDWHHVNEYLPGTGKLLEQIIEYAHAQEIRVIGRFDFSKAEDITYLQHPEWFVKKTNGQPLIYGSGRMGEWSLLMSTCINGGYRGEEVAIPVLKEALNTLDMDGIFFNAPQMEKCYCESCQKKYLSLYGEELPQDPKQWKEDWERRCFKDNMDVWYRTVKSIRKDIPVILYYSTYQRSGQGRAENLEHRYLTADLICTEAQDILSAGEGALPDAWKPTLNMKLGSLKGKPRPFGIIHSCPGMDWRHTGLPAAEYEFWLSQIPASNGQIWHSLTGFDETIADRRTLAVMERVNKKVELADPYMKEALSAASVLLLWDAGKSALGFTEALMSGHIPFDIMDIWHVDAEHMMEYAAVIVPDGFLVEEDTKEVLEKYVRQGGNLFVQKTDTNGLERMHTLLGICPGMECVNEISAAYGIFEPDGVVLNKELEETRYIPIKGKMLYVRKKETSRFLMTLIPPFAPLDGVGAPPERASLPCTRTQIPLLLENRYGKGRVISAFFDLSGLIWKVGLKDQGILFENCIFNLTKEKCFLECSQLPDQVYVYSYQCKDAYLIHLVNGVGRRPLRENHSCRELKFALKDNNDTGRYKAFSVLEKGRVSLKKKEGWLEICLEELRVWDLVVIQDE